jgi:hypothetical protein
MLKRLLRAADSEQLETMKPAARRKYLDGVTA